MSISPGPGAQVPPPCWAVHYTVPLTGQGRKRVGRFQEALLRPPHRERTLLCLMGMGLPRSGASSVQAPRPQTPGCWLSGRPLLDPRASTATGCKLPSALAETSARLMTVAVAHARPCVCLLAHQPSATASAQPIAVLCLLRKRQDDIGACLCHLFVTGSRVLITCPCDSHPSWC